jgi:endonuclease G
MQHVVWLACLAAACTAAPPGPSLGDDAPPDPSDGTLVPDDPRPIDSPHLALGIPADATPDDDHLLLHDHFAAGYSRHLNASNWVSWRTRREDFGPVERFPGPFYPDATLPAGWYRPDHPDFYSSGYDRGHMLRSEERTRTTEDNIATFVMTNILPQRADLNRGPWFDFELYIQRRVQSFSTPRDAYVMAGSIWPAACATHAPRVAGDGCLDIGRAADPARRIAVPAATWKVVVFVEAGVPPLDAADPYVVAVIMPNQRGIEEVRWWTYRTSVAEVELATGYDLPSLE